MRLIAFSLAVTVAQLAEPGSATSQPSAQVLAGSRLSAEFDSDSLLVSLEDDLGRAIPGARIEVPRDLLEKGLGADTPPTTNSRGQLKLTLHPELNGPVFIRFPGSKRFAASSTEAALPPRTRPHGDPRGGNSDDPTSLWLWIVTAWTMTGAVWRLVNARRQKTDSAPPSVQVEGYGSADPRDGTRLSPHHRRKEPAVGSDGLKLVDADLALPVTLTAATIHDPSAPSPLDLRTDKTGRLPTGLVVPPTATIMVAGYAPSELRSAIGQELRLAGDRRVLWAAYRDRRQLAHRLTSRYGSAPQTTDLIERRLELLEREIFGASLGSVAQVRTCLQELDALLEAVIPEPKHPKPRP